MSSIVRAADCPPQAWKNGMGTTREIAVQPSDDGADFLWRVSIAEIDSAAPFSAFAGIERHIVLLDGHGFHMTLDDGRVHALTTPFAPFGFRGEAKVAVALVDGPTRDFNLMVRRAQARGEIQVWTGAGSHRLDPAVVLVYAARGDIETAAGVLHAGDAWRADGAGAGERMLLRDNALALVVLVREDAGVRGRPSAG